MKMKMIREIQTQQTNDTNDDLIRVAFASELPVQREIQDQLYNEILLCTPENCDISYLQKTGAVLFNHDQDQLIGKIENVHIDYDRVCRAELKLSESTDKKQLFDEGILRNISVGYQILEYEIQGDDLLATKWQPYEISFVSCPADPTVGVNRGLDTEQDSEPESTEPEQDSNTENEIASTEPENQVTEPESTEPEQDSEQDSSTEPEQDSEQDSSTEPEQDSEPENQVTEPDEREKELRAIGQLYQIDPETIENAIRNLISVSDFKKNINKRNKPIENKDIKMEKNILAKLYDNFRSTGKFQLDDVIRGENGFKLSRAVTTTTGAGVISDIQYDGYIDRILADSLYAQLPIRNFKFNGVGNISIPKATVDSNNFGFVEEGVAVKDSTAAFSRVIMKPSRFAGSIPLTRELILSSENAVQYLEDILIRYSRDGLEHALVCDVEAVCTPVSTAVAATVSDSDILGIMEKLATANIKVENCIALVSPQMLTKLKATPVLKNTAGKALVQGDSAGNLWLMDTIRVICSTHVQLNSMIVGDFSYVIHADWTSDEIDVDDTTGRNSNTIFLRYTSFSDNQITNPEAFALLTLK
ncbi:phage major capsid protein [Edwardsiella piscicida]|uniref:phage major capsid protein n=1 Tax=Edwardsiella piscicida TaxID=1263550 RepID=UPI000D51F817|nr:phage major capsid protein [Edwardsiella piscicida]UCQ40056.1 phage major capsid protein [Edwardsiella piscicida]